MSGGERLAVGLDVGGTKINAFRVTERGVVVDRYQRRSPAEEADAIVPAMIEVAREALTDDVDAIGVGAAGLIAFAEGVVRFAPNLAWRDVPIAERLREALALPVVVDNDGNTAALAEHRFGAGRGHDEMLFVAVGTGIGGGIVSRGRLLRGAHGFAGDFGHIVVEPDGPSCGCGNRGCWEQVAAGRQIGRLGRAAASRSGGARLRELAGGDPDAVTGAIVTEAASASDPAAVAILDGVGSRLGEGIAGLVNTLDPSIVVVGGGALAAGELLLGPARAAFEATVEGRAFRPAVPIVPAELGNDAGAIGAAALALDTARAGS